MKGLFLGGIAALGMTFSAAHAATVTNTLFLDDFDLEAGEFNTALDNWTVLQGSVDVVGCSGSGNCVDLDGSMSGSPPTIMETNLAFSYVAGRTYTLSFDIPTGTEADPATFGFGSVLSESYPGYSFPLSNAISATATSSGAATLVISLDSATNNNFGPYLTSISLTETYDDNGSLPPIPLPASALLLLSGLVAVGALHRRTS